MMYKIVGYLFFFCFCVKPYKNNLVNYYNSTGDISSFTNHDILFPFREFLFPQFRIIICIDFINGISFQKKNGFDG